MKEWEVRLLHRRGAEIPEGFELAEYKNMDPHLLYSDGFLVREMTEEEKSESAFTAARRLAKHELSLLHRVMARNAQERCPHCGNPLIEDWNGAHYSCVHCKCITTSCCCGASDGESG